MVITGINSDSMTVDGLEQSDLEQSHIFKWGYGYKYYNFVNTHYNIHLLILICRMAPRTHPHYINT